MHMSLLVTGAPTQEEIEALMEPFSEHNDYPEETGDEDADNAAYAEWRKTAKWGWWLIGGRWRGFWQLKPDHLGEIRDGIAKVGRPGTGGNDPDFDCDVARKSWIDWEGMREGYVRQAHARWDEYQRVVSGEPIEGDVMHGMFMFGVRDGDTRETYVARADHPPTTYAILHEGRWYEQKEVYGNPDYAHYETMTDDEIREARTKLGNEWNAFWKELVDNLPDDTIMACIDYHN